MEASDILELIKRYNEGIASASDVEAIEMLIERGAITLDRFSELMQLEDRLFRSNDPSPTPRLDASFYKMLATEKKRARRFTFSFDLPSREVIIPRLAFAVALLLCGFGGGYWLTRPTSSSSEVAALSKEVGDLKEMMMLSMLEKESASERLKAVSLTSEMDQASKRVTTALLSTLNNDPNINVRLAALDALRPYVGENAVRTDLIKSILKQESPVVQVALAELMRDIQERRSVSEFDKLLHGNKTPEDVKKTIREKIQVLI